MAENQRKGGRAGRRKKLSPAGPPESTVTFDYIKSNFHRVVQVDGVVGGITPNGMIHMAVWNQRQPYPRQVVHELTEDRMGSQIDRTTRECDFVREIEVGLVLNYEMARVLVRWLEKRISDFEAVQEKFEAMEDEEPTETES